MRSLRTWIIPVIGTIAIAACAKSPETRPPESAQPQPELEAQMNKPPQSQAGEFDRGEAYHKIERAPSEVGKTQPGEGMGREVHAQLSADKGLCPIDVPGARGQTRNQDGNVILVVTTNEPNQVDELRRRARDFSSRTARFTSASGGSMSGEEGIENEGEPGTRGGATDFVGDDERNKSQTGQSGQQGQQGQKGQMTPYGQGTPQGQQPQKGQPGAGKTAQGAGIAVRVAVQDVTNGVTLVFTPTDASKLNELQGMIQRDAMYLGQGRCPIGERRTSMVH